MKTPSGEWLFLDTCASTQDVASSSMPEVGVVVARHQTAGRGRFGRTWVSEPESGLAMSMVFDAYRGLASPWLIGMSVAIAAAGVLHCRVQWPNDLVLEGLKLGGILTELVDGIPVVGVGVNLTLGAFPNELAGVPTSLSSHRALVPAAAELARSIVARVGGMPEPEAWSAISGLWHLFDATPGKRYRLASGEEGIAIAVGPAGELVLSVEGETRTVMAAEALFGP